VPSAEIKTISYKKNPANAKGNARQRCMCEGLVRTKFKVTTMFHLDSTADDAYSAISSAWISILAKNRKFFLPPSHLAPSFGVTPFKCMEKLYGFWN